MQASIDFDGTLIGSIAGGGGGGSDVSITPTYNQGTKIADYSIDGNEGALYIPEIEITKYVNSGVKICEINDVEIFAPSCGYIDTLGDSNVEQIGGFSQGANVTPVNVKKVLYTNDINNGEKIGSITVGDTSYNVYQKPNTHINYSTTKQKTGRKWIDGREIYLQVISGTTDNQLYYIPNTTDIDVLISYGGYITVSGYNFYLPYSDGGDYISVANGSGGIRLYTSSYFINKSFTIILEYVEAVQ